MDADKSFGNADFSPNYYFPGISPSVVFSSILIKDFIYNILCLVL